MKRQFQILVVLCALLLGFIPEAVAHTDISVPDANDLILSNNDLVIIDVREQSEYCGELGHIHGAHNYPLNSGVLEASYEDFSQTDEILVVCRTGGRSNAAADFLDSKGYLYVYDMSGGTTAWKVTYGYNTTGCIDSDIDGFNDDLNNCPDDYNPSQTDSDNDRTGNVCDDDCPNLDELNPVSFADFAILAANWQLSGPPAVGNLNSDETVDIEDLIIFAQYWLSNCYE